MSMNKSEEAVNVLTLKFGKAEDKIVKLETDVKGATKCHQLLVIDVMVSIKNSKIFRKD